MKLLLLLFLVACTASPTQGLRQQQGKVFRLPAPCLQVCEMQIKGQLPGKCSLREWRRYKLMSGCEVVWLPGGR